MKRSEMIERLVFYILESSGHDDATDFAEGILDWLEEQGMQPPPYTFKHEVVNPDTVNTISVTNYEWEDEE